jgi:hypothetical protein
MNPYAPPGQQQQPTVHGYRTAGGYAAWPDGKGIAVQKDAALPPVCVKCGMHGNQRRNQQFVWTPPWVFIIFFVSPIIGAIVAMVVQKKGRLQLPLCDACFSRWKMGTLIIVGGVLYMLVAIFAGIIIAANEWPEIGVPILISSLVFLIVAIVVANKRFLRASKVDDHMITIPGIHANAVQAILQASGSPPQPQALARGY